MANGATMCLAVSLSPEAAPSHPPGAGPDFSLLARFVQEAEAAGLDMVLLGDSAPVAGGPNRQMRFEATTLLAALATVTSRIGLVAAASTVAHQPYNLARRFASLDIISHGRAGWNASMTPNRARRPISAGRKAFPATISACAQRNSSASCKVCGKAGTQTRCCSTKLPAASSIPRRCTFSTTRGNIFPCASRST